jgi:hypothetical protein
MFRGILGSRENFFSGSFRSKLAQNRRQASAGRRSASSWSRPFRQFATELLIEAADHKGNVDDAAAQLSRALAAEGLL